LFFKKKKKKRKKIRTGEFMNEFFEDLFIKLNGNEYINDGDNFRKLRKMNTIFN